MDSIQHNKPTQPLQDNPTTNRVQVANSPGPRVQNNPQYLLSPEITQLHGETSSLRDDFKNIQSTLEQLAERVEKLNDTETIEREINQLLKKSPY